MAKSGITTVRKKNSVIAEILSALSDRQSFLVLGHRNPDVDCAAAMTAFSLLVVKFGKQVSVYFGKPVDERFSFLADILRYNEVEVIEDENIVPELPDTIVTCDTPNPSLIEANGPIRSFFVDSDIRRIEVDHHLGSDSEWTGDEGYRLVMEATSSCELIGHIALKLQKRRDLLERFAITELFTRNLTLSLLTGIIGDSQLGKYLSSHRKERAYRSFVPRLESLLAGQTVNADNFSTKEEIYEDLRRLSENEHLCFQALLEMSERRESIAWAAVDRAAAERLVASYGREAFGMATREAVDMLAETSGKLGLIAFPDLSDGSLIHFRLRRSGSYGEYDLRSALRLFPIVSGGGHEGAVSFRISAGDAGEKLSDFTRSLVTLVADDLVKG